MLQNDVEELEQNFTVETTNKAARINSDSNFHELVSNGSKILVND